MSCKKCDNEPLVTYIRIGNGNVEIRGCEEHLKRLIGLVRLGLELEEKKEKERERWHRRYEDPEYREKCKEKSKERMKRWLENPENRAKWNAKRRERRARAKEENNKQSF